MWVILSCAWFWFSAERFVLFCVDDADEDADDDADDDDDADVYDADDDDDDADDDAYNNEGDDDDNGYDNEYVDDGTDHDEDDGGADDDDNEHDSGADNNDDDGRNNVAFFACWYRTLVCASYLASLNSHKNLGVGATTRCQPSQSRIPRIKQ